MLGGISQVIESLGKVIKLKTRIKRPKIEERIANQ